jgi:hypothetical protein
MNTYWLQARLQPALLSLLPLLFGTIAFLGPDVRAPAIITGAFAAAGVTFLLGMIAGNRGKKAQVALYKLWGGPPTTLLLRHRGEANAELRERWHGQLSSLTGMSLPTLAVEEADAAKADSRYEAVTRILIGKTNENKKFPAVFRDNVYYGFCRNLYGLKAFGIFCSSISIAASALALVVAIRTHANFIIPAACLALSLGFLFVWIFIVNPAWVRISAFRYAQHLLESLEVLKPLTSRTKKN